MSPSPQLADPAAEVVALRARLDALLGVRAAVRRLAELGPVAEIVDRGPAEAAAALGLGRVLLSRVEDGALVAEALHAPADPDGAPVTLARLQERPVPIDYPLVEGEVLRRRRPQLVEPDPEAPVPASRHAFADAMGWETYVAAPIVLEARVIGFFQGDRPAGPVVGEVERDGLGDFADGFALVFERAILRRRLRIQRQEMRQVASWADARTSELSDRAVTLAFDREPADEEAGGRAVSGAGPDTGALRDLLTRRELDVLELMVKGETNAGIARALVVSEGTVKFHVKNILRKLHASNRAEATSRYLRLTLRRGEGPPAI
ncbi:MAG: GAF domain-containing protein [Solirubrobacteraceae bacterium]|nr:GAF domain-containing protein [Solirubrobacteraceae bacterium]